VRAELRLTLLLVEFQATVCLDSAGCAEIRLGADGPRLRKNPHMCRDKTCAHP